MMANDLGKTKMLTQVTAVAMLLLRIRCAVAERFRHPRMWIVVIFAIASGDQYFLKFWRKVDDSIKHRRRQQLLRIERQRKRMMRSQAGKPRRWGKRSTPPGCPTAFQSLSLGGEKIWKLSGVNSTVNTCPRAPSFPSSFPFNAPRCRRHCRRASSRTVCRPRSWSDWLRGAGKHRPAIGRHREPGGFTRHQIQHHLILGRAGASGHWQRCGLARRAA